MFPNSLVDQVVDRFTSPGESLLDPFAGRASSIFGGATKGRPSFGVEINPVGWIYGKTKLSVAPADQVLRRIHEIVAISGQYPLEIEGDLCTFFQLCFSECTLQFLLAARAQLDWKNSAVDRTLMTLILVDLHGIRHRSFSNQTRQSRAMNPDYSVRWWRTKQLAPPIRDPEAFLQKKVRWRFRHGVPQTVDSDVLLGDSCQLLSSLRHHTHAASALPFKLLFTSPPYMNITDYYRDQWLRLWMLGDDPSAVRTREPHKGAFNSAAQYRDMLSTVFRQSAEMMSARGCVYVRTDARPTTFDITWSVLRDAFPRWKAVVVDQPAPDRTQTALYGDTGPKPGERDIILTGPLA